LATRTTDSAAKVKFQEDLLYLQNMQRFDGDKRIGKIGAFDQHLATPSRTCRQQNMRKAPLIMMKHLIVNLQTNLILKQLLCLLMPHLNRIIYKKKSLQSDLNGVSIRQQLQYTSSLIQSSGGTIYDISWSRTSLGR